MRRSLLTVLMISGSFLLYGQYGPPPQQPGYPQGPAPGYPQGPGPGQAPPQNPDQDQPGQPVARISVLNGEASIKRADSNEWVAAALNVPLMAGDSLSVAPNGRAEVQLDNADFIRVGGDTEIHIAELAAGRNQIQMARGLITYRVLRDTSIESEISTPSVAVHPLRDAAVRVEVAPDGSARIVVRRGEVEASTQRGTERIADGRMMLVRGGADEPEYQVVNAPVRDGWDSFGDQRDSVLVRAQSPRYLSQDIYGSEDLDPYGRWDYDPAYGNVWAPTVAADWAPYRNGQWVWEDSYGWTWVPLEPWGWAPFHYGSWYFRTGFGWRWFPGARYGHYWWHPAMVSFFGFGGGGGVGFGFGNVGWIPLAPFEPFRPWYGRGGRPGYGVNVVNVNVYNSFRNARFAGGVTAVSSQDFQRGVFRNQVAVNASQLERASLVRGGVPVSPTANNFRFSDRPAPTSAPRGEIANQRFFSRMAPMSRQSAPVPSGFSGNGGFRGNPAGPGVSQDSGWRRFGSPNQAPSGSPNPAARPQPSGTQRGGWERFGAPQTGAPQPAPQSSAPQRFAAPPASSQVPAYSQGARQNPGPSRSIQLAPPMVRQRESAQSFRSAPSAPSGPRGGSGGGGGRPSGGSSNHGRR